jgi:hypothetical protein
VPLPPRTTPPISPVEYFRELLALNSEARERALADKPEIQRKYLQAKLLEYEQMPPEDRELRLRVTELRYHLLPLLKTPASDRAERLKLVPERDRALIEERLKQWDSLPADVREELLENEITVRYFLRLDQAAPSRREEVLRPLPEDYRSLLEEKLAKWKEEPPEERQRMYRHFERFFELSRSEKQKALNTLPEEERTRIEGVILDFEKLQPEERVRCIENFRKLANMEKEASNRFWNNVRRWEAMTPREREAWRDLFHSLPPNPPGFSSAGPPTGTNYGNRQPPGGVSKPAPDLPGSAR